MALGNRLVATIVASLAAATGAFACGPERLEPVRLDRITVEGDIRLADGRLLAPAGLNAAEARAPLAALLADGPPLAIGRLGAEKDRWGREPALLFFLPDDAPPLFLQGLLLRQGQVRVRPAADLGECLPILIAAEAEGRQARNGRFAGEDRALPAWRTPADPAALAGRFVVLEGRLLRLGEGRRQFFLNFAARRDEGFLVTVDRRLESRFRSAGVDLRRLQGETLRIRGLASVHDGRRLVLSTPAQIERIAHGPLAP
jgi:hypothetical protein